MPPACATQVPNPMRRPSTRPYGFDATSARQRPANRSMARPSHGPRLPEDGRAGYQKALDIFAKYPGYDRYTMTSTSIWTELSWARAEANFGSSLATEHVENAEKLVASMSPGPGTDSIKSQVSQLKQQLASGAPIPPIQNPVSASLLEASAKP